MSRQILVVVQGGSATGKTTLVKKLSTDLELYALTKDNFKEMMYDVLGIPKDREESTLYGLAATKALYAAADTFLDAQEGVIIESAFNKKFALEDIHQLILGKNVQLLQIHVTASPEVRLQRYNDRILSGERHKGHPDGVGAYTIESFSSDGLKYGKLDIDDTVEVDTDNFDDSDYAKLLSSMKTMIGDINEATN